jgi:hypothetical protein
MKCPTLPFMRQRTTVCEVKQLVLPAEHRGHIRPICYGLPGEKLT